mmetsp:Transcript_19713/g.23457  ORF Transcript_19713/g.23457 Transcript_19713/m.23457 type:complete len:217 (+) Transcript_19713:114-764(+)|eukprot:CAMPEP_0114360662 /NCGR_PEP_ID=MMETSP0101-20121206/24034_1 /TAXON_ID=38822 ORGANISM="Pteridomonas danica, Strain PT" /NCGR_SAMPLE_ID=MMETSP0101 /ASSEMBLY_ACC=CAM_ASM_000211 /LENGTH=216 /DNA_ID=CAMNT_0001505015 /DNA_START=31 /DNA_END=681 /DNA_ORIENTATION=+
MANLQSDVPICPSCKHPHYPEVRCSICGHKGKGNSFRLPKFQGADNNLHFIDFDASATEDCWCQQITNWNALSSLAGILRRHVFCTELKILEEQEFTEDDSSPNTRHILGFLGDSPVSYARWRLQIESDTVTAVIDRLCVKDYYRGRGIARATLHHAMQDIHVQLHHVPAPTILVLVPVDAVDMQTKLQQEGGVIMTNQVVSRGVPNVCFLLTPTG